MPKGIYLHKKNRVFSKIHRQHLKEASWNRGIKMSDEQKQYLSELNAGSKHPRWRGGIFTVDPALYKRIHAHKRRVVLRAASGSFTVDEWELLKSRYNHICPSCGKQEPEINLTIDHIIPISKGGSNNIENIQPLCGSCNSRKGTKIYYYEIIS